MYDRVLDINMASVYSVAERWAWSFDLVWFVLRPCHHDDGYIDGRSQI